MTIQSAKIVWIPHAIKLIKKFGWIHRQCYGILFIGKYQYKNLISFMNGFGRSSVCQGGQKNGCGDANGAGARVPGAIGLLRRAEKFLKTKIFKNMKIYLF